MAPADLGLCVLFGLGFFLAPLQFRLVEPRAQHGHRGGAIAVLRAVVLALHDDVGRQMGDPHR